MGAMSKSNFSGSEEMFPESKRQVSIGAGGQTGNRSHSPHTQGSIFSKSKTPVLIPKLNLPVPTHDVINVSEKHYKVKKNNK